MAQDNAAQDRANLKTQLRSDIATQATNVFVLVGSGGLAGILTWLQSLSIDSKRDSCDAVLTTALSGAASLLLLAILAAAASYLLRYGASFLERRAVAWVVALGCSALLVVCAGAWVTYSATNCARIALETAREMSEESAAARFRLGRLAGKTDAQMLDEARQESHTAAMELELAIAEATLRDVVALEQKIVRAQELKAEFNRRASEYPALQKDFDAELKKLTEIENGFRESLSTTISQAAR